MGSEPTLQTNLNYLCINAMFVLYFDKSVAESTKFLEQVLTQDATNVYVMIQIASNCEGIDYPEHQNLEKAIDYYSKAKASGNSMASEKADFYATSNGKKSAPNLKLTTNAFLFLEDFENKITLNLVIKKRF